MDELSIDSTTSKKVAKSLASMPIESIGMTTHYNNNSINDNNNHLHYEVIQMNVNGSSNSNDNYDVNCDNNRNDLSDQNNQDDQNGQQRQDNILLNKRHNKQRVNLRSFGMKTKEHQHKLASSALDNKPHFIIDWRNLTYFQNDHSFLAKAKKFNSQLSLVSGKSSPTNSANATTANDFNNYGNNNQHYHARKRILNSLDGRFKSGQLNAILGPSGAGKTTFLSALFGDKQDSAYGQTKVSWFSDSRHEQPLSKSDIGKRPIRIAFLPQHDHLLHHLTVYETLMFASKIKNATRYSTSSTKNDGNNNDNSNRSDIKGKDQTFASINCHGHKKTAAATNKTVINSYHRQNVKRVAKMLKLTDCFNTKCGKLSGGQYKRVSIGQELLSEPDVIILDEPTSGLDAMTCLTTIKTLKSIVSKRPMSIILTIHQPDIDVFNLFDQIYVIAQGGTAIYEGRPDDAVQTLARAGLFMPTAAYNPARFLIENAFLIGGGGGDNNNYDPNMQLNYQDDDDDNDDGDYDTSNDSANEPWSSSNEDDNDEDGDGDAKLAAYNNNNKRASMTINESNSLGDGAAGGLIRRSLLSLTEAFSGVGKSMKGPRKRMDRNFRDSGRRPLLNIGIQTSDGRLITSDQLAGIGRHASVASPVPSRTEMRRVERLNLLRRLNAIQKARYHAIKPMSTGSRDNNNRISLDELILSTDSSQLGMSSKSPSSTSSSASDHHHDEHSMHAVGLDSGQLDRATSPPSSGDDVPSLINDNNKFGRRQDSVSIKSDYSSACQDHDGRLDAMSLSRSTCGRLNTENGDATETTANESPEFRDAGSATANHEQLTIEIRSNEVESVAAPGEHMIESSSSTNNSLMISPTTTTSGSSTMTRRAQQNDKRRLKFLSFSSSSPPTESTTTTTTTSTCNDTTGKLLLHNGHQNDKLVLNNNANRANVVMGDSGRKLKRQFDKCLSAKHNNSKQKDDPVLYHTYLLTHRTWLSIVRDPVFFGIQFCMHTTIPILLSLIFGSNQEEGCPRLGSFDLIEFAYSNSEDITQSTVRSIRQSIGNIGVVFFEMFVLCFAINCITALVFPLDMFVLLKEYRNGWYSLRSYFFGRTLADLPVPIVLHSMAMTIMYFMTGQPLSLARFAAIIGIVILASLIAQSVGLTIGALLMRSSQSAVLAAAGIVAPFFALSGFIVRIHTLPWLAQFFANSSYLYHLLNGFIILRYGFNRCPCQDQDFEPNLAHEMPKNLKTMASIWVGTYSDEFAQSSHAVQQQASLANKTQNIDPNIDVVDKLASAFRISNSYGHKVDTCADVLPYAMLDFNLRDLDVYWCIYSLIIMLIVSRFITFSAIYYKVRSYS